MVGLRCVLFDDFVALLMLSCYVVGLVNVFGGFECWGFGV